MAHTATQRVSREVKAQMVRHDISVEDLATGMGLSAPALYRRLRGDVEWDLSDLLAVSQQLGVPVAQLVEDVA